MKIRKSKSANRTIATQLVEERIGEFLKNRSQTVVPIEELCRRNGVAEITYEPMPVEGYIVNSDDGCAIRVNSNRHKFRQRFTIAHELAHIFVAERNGQAINMKCRSRDFSSEEETLVDMVAAEILLPSNELRDAIRQKNFSNWELVKQLHFTYQVSYTATIRRILDLPDIHGVWLSGNATSCQSMRAWGSDVVTHVERLSETWRDFCWDAEDGKKSEVDIRVFDRSGHERISLSAELKVMTRMGARLNPGVEPNNRWILGWVEKPKPKTQSTFSFYV